MTRILSFTESRPLQDSIPLFLTARKIHITPQELHEARDYMGLSTAEFPAPSKMQGTAGAPAMYIKGINKV